VLVDFEKHLESVKWNLWHGNGSKLWTMTWRCWKKTRRTRKSWTQRGAHLFLQTRVQILNDDLRKTFDRWFPGMKAEVPAALKQAA
jgi:hypothetical protein